MTGAAPPIDNSDKQNFDQAYRELIESDRFQTEMTRFEPPVPREPPNWLVELLQWLGTLGPVWQGLFWITVGGLAALILFSIGRAIYRRFTNQPVVSDEDESDVDSWRPEARTAHGLLGEADALPGTR